MAVGLWRVRVGGRARLARGPAEAGPAELLATGHGIGDLLAAGAEDAALDGPVEDEVPAGAETWRRSTAKRYGPPG